MNTDSQHIIFSDEAYNAIMTETFKMNPNETGGILLGHVLDNGIWIVMEVLPPGWRSVFQYAYFEYDEQFVNYVAQNESKKYEQELSLLGLWHRHPGSMDTFSGTDDGTNRTFAGLHPKGAISGLVNIDPRFRLTMYHCATPLRYTKVEYDVGDDLIPKEYFKLKYYDEEKGLNPFPPEKKNDRQSTGKKYEIGSKENNTQKSSGIVPTILQFLDSKYVFFLIFLVLLVTSVLSQYSYNKVKGTEDVKSLHKIVYCVPPNDSIVKAETKIAGENFDEEQFIKTFKNDYYQKLDVKQAGKEVKGIVLILWVFTALSLLVALFLRYRKFFLSSFAQKEGAKYWFQKHPKLYLDEETEIRNRFRGMEKTIENGIVSFFVPTDKKIDTQAENLSFQLVYAADYDKNKEIKIYLITPDLNELLGEKINDFPYIAIDGAGESYLDLSKTIAKNKVSGMQVVRKLYEWLQFYNRWQKQEISIKDIKL